MTEKEIRVVTVGCFFDENRAESVEIDGKTDVEQSRVQGRQEYEFDFSILKNVVLKLFGRIYGISPQFLILVLGIIAFLTLCLPVMDHAGVNVVGVGFQNIFAVHAGNVISLLCVILFLVMLFGIIGGSIIYYKSHKNGRSYRNKSYYIVSIVLGVVLLAVTSAGVGLANDWCANAGVGMIVGVLGSAAILLLIIDRMILGLFVVKKEREEKIVLKKHDVPSTVFDIGIIVAGVVVVLLFYLFWPAFSQKQLNENVLADCVTRAETEEELGRPFEAESDDSRYDYYDNNYSSLLAIIDKLELEQFELLEKAATNGSNAQKYLDKIEKIDECLVKLNEKKSKTQYSHTAIYFKTRDEDSRKDTVESYYCEIVNPTGVEDERSLSSLTIAGVFDEKWSKSESKLESCTLKYKARYSDGTYIVNSVSVSFDDKAYFSDIFGSYEINRTDVEEVLLK